MAKQLVEGRIKSVDVTFSALGADAKIIFGMRRQLLIRDELIYRKWRDIMGKERLQLVAPREIRNEVMRLGHDVMTSGHLGFRRTKSRISKTFGRK